MNFELQIDMREAAVIQGLKTLNTEYTVKPLPIGDFLINKNGIPFALYERKTYADLVASLKDSRFREQKHRMQNSPAEIQGYIIEGSYPKGPVSGIKPSTIDSILLGLALRDKYTVLYSTSPTHTAEVLTKMLVKFKEWATSASAGTAHQDALIQGSIVKKDGLTVETCYLAQLAQIPGISLVTARAIQNKWQTLAQFMNFLHGPTRSSLSELLVNDKRLGKIAAERILTYLYDPALPVVPLPPKKIVVKLKQPVV